MIQNDLIQFIIGSSNIVGQVNKVGLTMEKMHRCTIGTIRGHAQK